MRLEELFQPILNEAPGDEKGPRTVTLTMVELFEMNGQTPPMKEGPNGTMVWADPKMAEPITIEVGDEQGQLRPDVANTYEIWKESGAVPGMIPDENGELKPYFENNIAVDLAYQFSAGSAELLANWTRGGAYAIDRAMNGLGVISGDYIGYSGELKLTKKTTSDEFLFDKAQKWFEDNTDQDFKDNMAKTAGAVKTWDDFGTLLFGGTGFNLEGMAGIVVGELPSEIVDATLYKLATVTGGATVALSTVLNGLEAGGAAAKSIRQRIEKAFDDGQLQAQPIWTIYTEAARMQLAQEQPELQGEKLKEAIDAMSLDMAVDRSTKHAFLKVAATGGAIASVQNKLLYSGPISQKFLKNAMAKGATGVLGEGVSGYVEQVFENLGIMSGAGKITYATEDAVNAAYNEALAGTAAGAVSTVVDAGARFTGARAALRQFLMGGSKDVESLVTILGMDPKQLITRMTDNRKTIEDPNNPGQQIANPNFGKLQVANILSKRLITSKDLSKTELRRLGLGFGNTKIKITKDGQQIVVSKKEILANDKAMKLANLMDNIEIDPKENVAVLMYDDEQQVRDLASLLDIPNAKKAKISDLMAEIEDVRKVDIRIQGRSKLEAPVWSDLNDRQRTQYWKEGKVTFNNDPERGNQTWTRDQVLYNSRRNNDNIPDDIANLADNTEARPSLENSDIGKEINMLQQSIDSSPAMIMARKKLKDDQADWDAEAKKNGIEATTAEYGPRPSKDMPGDPYNFTGAEASVSMLKREQNQLRDSLLADQKQWDQEFGETHTRDGVVVIQKRRVSSQLRAIQDQVSIDNDARAREAMGPNEGFKDVVVHAPTGDSNNEVDRTRIIQSIKTDIASGTSDPTKLETRLEALEKAYPGISNEIISPSDLNALQNGTDVESVQNKVGVEPGSISADINVSARPPRGTEVELDGTTYRFLGRMWAPVKPNGDLGATGHQNHQQLMKNWRDDAVKKSELGDNAKLPEITGLGTSPNVGEGPNAVEVNTNAPALPSVDTTNQTLDALKDKNPQDKPVKVSNNAELATPKPKDNTFIKPEDPSEVEVDDQVPFLVPPASDADAQSANIAVPDSVSQKFADVLATKNAIKVSKFLNGLPPKQAGKLRYDYGQGNFDVQPTKPPNVDTNVGANTQAALGQTDTTTSTSGVEVKPIDDKPVTTKSQTLPKPSDKDADPEIDTTPSNKVNVGKPPITPKFGTPSQTVDINPSDFRQPKVSRTAPTLTKPSDKDVDPEIDTKPKEPTVKTTGPGMPTVSTQGDDTTSGVEVEPTDDKPKTDRVGPNLATPQSDRKDVDPEVDTTPPEQVKSTDTDTLAGTEFGTTPVGTLPKSKTQQKAQTKQDTKVNQKSKIANKRKLAKRMPGGDDKKKKPRPLPSASPIKFDDPLKLGSYQTVGQGSLFK